MPLPDCATVVRNQLPDVPLERTGKKKITARPIVLTFLDSMVVSVSSSNVLRPLVLVCPSFAVLDQQFHSQGDEQPPKVDLVPCIGSNVRIPTPSVLSSLCQGSRRDPSFA